MTKTRVLGLQDETFGSSDDQIESRIISRRLNFSDTTVDECTDFYTHVCGGRGGSEHSRPSVLDKESWSKILNARLEALIGADITPDDEPAIRKVKRQYQLCIDYGKRDQEGFDLLKFLIRKDSDFPMIMARDSWNNSTLRILEPQKYDSSLFSIRVRNEKIYIDKYDVSVYGRFLSNLKNVSGITHPVMYKSEIRQVFKHMGLMNEITEHDFESDLDAVMRLRRELHQIANSGKSEYTQVSVRELQALISTNHTSWPQLDWDSFIRDVFRNVTGVDIDSDRKVEVEMDYMIAMMNILQRYDPQSTANHIKLHFLETYLSETSRTLMQFSKNLAIAAHGKIDFRKSSWNPCIQQPHILRALNYMYLKKWLPKESWDAALSMKNGIKKSLLKYVRATKIIPHRMIQWVEEQVHQTLIVIGSKKKYGEYEFLDPLYRYEVPDDHLSSVLNARRYFKEYEYSTLGTFRKTLLVDLDVLGDDSYVSVQNSIIHFPIGYLHRSSLSPTSSMEKSYATLGHKISLFLNEVIIRRGFYSRQFSKELIWYSVDAEALSNRTACMENQYRLEFLNHQSISAEELKKTYNTMLERFVYDNAAFQILYDAFSSALHQDPIPIKEESFIKRMKREFTKNWASTYCIYDKEDKRNPSPLRVNNVLQNTNIMYSSFDCRNGTLMNPRNKCIFWG